MTGAYVINLVEYETPHLFLAVWDTYGQKICFVGFSVQFFSVSFDLDERKLSLLKFVLHFASFLHIAF